MALTWDVSNIADHESVTTAIAEYDDPNHGIKVGDRVWNPITNALVWASMAVGLPGISEQDAPEFWARLSLYEKVCGTFLQNEDGPMPLTKEDVLRHVGLRTNVSKETRAAWLKRVIGYDLDKEKGRFETFASEPAAA